MPEPLPASKMVIDRIREIRRAKGVAVEQLAQLMTDNGYAVERTLITHAENGRRREVSVDWVAAACAALGLDIVHVMAVPSCKRCNDVPPSGFTCNSCGVVA